MEVNMAPKLKVTREQIIKTALEMTRRGGAQSVNARSVADALNCSTQPIFSNFEGIEALHRAVRAAAYELYYECLRRASESGEFVKYKAYGMGYIRFAREEKQLFRLLFMADRSGEEQNAGTDFDESVEMISAANGISRELAELIHLEMWSTVHGIAVMQATSFLPLEEELISRILTDVYQGIRVSVIGKDKK